MDVMNDDNECAGHLSKQSRLTRVRQSARRWQTGQLVRRWGRRLSSGHSVAHQ
ncbi:hypothetical protein SZN_04561 [Streptomyces zinciresistens K42]|uniref:Uncharacterized protein n=1 Tax=Streptomyces zinciresistens K42 TaxID=700597 RepID=G2G606_9ACTN|nr:hypothetical protein SZN_04561 [Streptomyces zinciresistens K42]